MKQLVAHHGREAAHLTARWDLRPAAESWPLRRAQFLGWNREPLTLVLVDREGTNLLGYALVRIEDGAGTRGWRTTSV